jgi:hypothetical protein
MNTRRLFLITSFAIAASILTAGGVMAMNSPSYRLSDTIKTTKTSGKNNVDSSAIGHQFRAKNTGPIPFGAVYEIQMAEKSDSPCFLQTRSRHLNMQSHTVTMPTGGKQTILDPGPKEDQLKGCGGTSGNASSLKTLSFDLSHNSYISGIRVCLNSNGTRVKGLRVYGRQLNRSTGNLVDLPYKEWFRPNCTNWRKAHMCPEGQIASAVIAKYEGPQVTNRAISGLALQCRSVLEYVP